MKNHELLDMIGEVSEEYVLAAGDNVVKPRFRWGTLAACAACAALVLGAYPVYRAFNPPLHDYTVMEGGALTTEGDTAPVKAPAGSGIDIPGQNAPVPEPDQPPRGDGPSDVLGGAYIGDAPVQPAAEWYDTLLHTYRLEENPEWYGGAWLAEDELLAVSIVDGFRTPELEAELRQAAGAGAVLQFSTVKYSMEFLYGLMEPVTRVLDGTGLSCGIGVDVTANCLGLDLYSDGAVIPDNILAKLAHLDPDGDAIRVRVFTQTMNTLTDEVKKGPAPVPGGVTEPVFNGARAEPNEEPAPPRVEDSEWTMPAEEPGEIEDLPQRSAAAKPTPEPAEYLPDIIEGPDE